MKHKTPVRLIALLALLVNFFTAARAQGVFGNNPTPDGAGVFSFVADGGIAGGGAVAFTPLHDFTVSSITIWLTGYTGLDMYGNANQSFYAGIYSDQLTIESGYTNDQPGTLLVSLDAPAPNDGSLAAFTFASTSPTTTLQANTKYWLFIYEATSGSFNYDSYPQWVEGDTPAGDALYDGAQSFWASTFSPSSDTPAFTINAVPEPKTGTMFTLALLAWMIAGFYWRRRKI
jgi:hypothetical protein